jgi:hypothetical protein
MFPNFENFSGSKINDFDLIELFAGFKQDVFRLKITVNDIVMMAV